jgi:hypothetical protein
MLFISLKEESTLKHSGFVVCVRARACVRARVWEGKYVCPHVSSLQLLNPLTDIHETWYER